MKLVLMDQAVIAQVYCDDISSLVSIPFMRQHLQNAVYQQNKATFRPYMAILTMELLR